MYKVTLAYFIILFPTLLSADTVSFQEGVNGYDYQEDLCISPSGGIWTMDVRLAMDASPRYQTLIRFDHIFGSGSNQIPPGAHILGAVIKLKTGNRVSTSSGTTNDIGIYRVNVPWTEASRWDDFSTLNDTVGAKAVSTLIGTYTATIRNDETTLFDVTAAVKAWHSGSAENNGVLFVNDGSDGCDYWSDASPFVAERPMLEVQYVTAPAIEILVFFDHVELSFHTELNFQYQVQSSPDLSASSWMNLGSAVAGTGSTKTAQDSRSVTDKSKFYRVSMTPDPG